MLDPASYNMLFCSFIQQTCFRVCCVLDMWPVLPRATVWGRVQCCRLVALKRDVVWPGASGRLPGEVTLDGGEEGHPLGKGRLYHTRKRPHGRVGPLVGKTGVPVCWKCEHIIKGTHVHSLSCLFCKSKHSQPFCQGSLNTLILYFLGARSH